MTPLLKKLNFKNQKDILILNAPSEFLTEMKGMEESAKIYTEVTEVTKIEFVITFVRSPEEVEASINTILLKANSDLVLWYAYPKGTSKKYKASINRDKGWEALGNHGFDTVRAVAIDEDWSALRFRPAEQIKYMTRDPKHALSTAGKERTSKK